VVVRGLVQGVGYRYTAVQAAGLRGLAGWVRNRPDGSVEAVFEGDRDAVESMIEWCRRGPAGADVDAIEIDDEPPEGLDGFRVR
jgi:acylphosphatase